MIKSFRPAAALALGAVIGATAVAGIVAALLPDRRTPGALANCLLAGGLAGFLTVLPGAAGVAFRAPLARLLAPRAFAADWYASLLGAAALGYFLASLHHRTRDVFTWLAAAALMLGAGVKILIRTVFARDVVPPPLPQDLPPSA